MIAIYQIKPIKVRATQWTGSNLSEVESLCGNVDRYISLIRDVIVIHSSYGDSLVSVGDYIIKESNGSLRACKADVFEATYKIAALDKGLFDSSKEKTIK
jgi:hypothetical protein